MAAASVKEFPGRVVPDVSYDAGVAYDVYDSFTGGGGWIDVGGTSAGSPQWAGLVAIADQGRVLSGQSTLNGATQTITALHAAPSSDFNAITGGTSRRRPVWAAPKPICSSPIWPSYGTRGGGTTTTTTAPAAPASVSATANSSTSVTVSWSASTGATGYDLYELENGQSVLIGSYAAGTTSASVSGLSASNHLLVPGCRLQRRRLERHRLDAGHDAGGGRRARRAAEFPSDRHQQHDGRTFVASGQRGHRLPSVRVERQFRRADRHAGSRQHLAQRERIGAGSTEYFYVTAYNATSSASTAWVSVVMPAARPPRSPRPWSPQRPLPAPPANSRGRLRRATGYEIYYLNGGQAVPLGSVGSSTTSVTISGMSPGTTYEFLVQAYNSTSQANSQWTALTTTGSAAGHHFQGRRCGPWQFVARVAHGRRYVQRGRRQWRTGRGRGGGDVEFGRRQRLQPDDCRHF